MANEVTPKPRRKRKTFEEMTPEQQEAELERRRKIGQKNSGRKRPDLALRNQTKESRERPRVISDEARARMAAERTVHGHARVRSTGRPSTRTYESWAKIVQRCNNPKSPDWHLYGGRGIQICDRWLVFENFLADMGERSPGLTIDRIDNDGDYEPGNCRWATATEQARNKRSNHMLTFDGRTLCLAEWAELSGLSYKALYTRLLNGWTTEEALSIPLNGHRAHLGTSAILASPTA